MRMRSISMRTMVSKLVIASPEIVYAVDCGQDGQPLSLCCQGDPRAGRGSRHRRHARHHLHREPVPQIMPHVLDQVGILTVEHRVALGDESDVPSLPQPGSDPLRHLVPGIVAYGGVVRRYDDGQHFRFTPQEALHDLQGEAGRVVVQLGVADDANVSQETLGSHGQQFRVARTNTYSIKSADIRHYCTY